jgi:hypothetical protein
MSLTARNVSSIKAGLALLSSGGDPQRLGTDYSQMTPDMRAGRYAFTAQHLEQAGYYKPGYAMQYGNQSAYRQDVWTKKDGIFTMRQFLNSAGVQEQMMQSLLEKNYKALIAAGVMGETSPASHQAGMLFATHLLGVDGAVSWAASGVGRDALGNKATDYYAQGHYMVANNIAY